MGFHESEPPPPGSSQWSLNIVKGPSISRFPRAIGIPVFGGKAVFQRMPPLREGRLVCSIKMCLALNPTRFADSFPEGAPYSPHTPRRNYRPRPESLDGNDNFLRDYHLLNHQGVENWRECHQQYLQVVISGIQAEMRRAAVNSDCSMDFRSTDFNLKECEVYWVKALCRSLGCLQSPKLSEKTNSGNVGNCSLE